MIPYVYITFQKFIPFLILKQAKICIENNTGAEISIFLSTPASIYITVQKRRGKEKAAWGGGRVRKAFIGRKVGK